LARKRALRTGGALSDVAVDTWAAVAHALARAVARLLVRARNRQRPEIMNEHTAQ